MFKYEQVYVYILIDTHTHIWSVVECINFVQRLETLANHADRIVFECINLPVSA